MVQKFSQNDAEEDKFFAVWEAMIEQTFTDLEEYFENVDQSPALGNALYDANSVEVWNILEKSFFLKIFDTLISSGYTAGAVDTYCRVIYALFGDETEITIETNPLEITIGIVAEYSNTAIWRSKGGNVMTTREGNVLAFRTLLTNIPRTQLSALLRAITNAGTKVNFNLN
jgi:hypothetical protein